MTPEEQWLANIKADLADPSRREVAIAEIATQVAITAQLTQALTHVVNDRLEPETTQGPRESHEAFVARLRARGKPWRKP